MATSDMSELEISTTEMPTVTCSIEGSNETLPVRVRGDRQVGKFFIWSQHKAGSSLLTAMLTAYLSKAKVTFVNLPAELFRKGIPSGSVTAESYGELFNSEVSGFIGWRNPHPLTSSQFSFSLCKHILLVRDPRDRLVSWYHSIAKSHDLPDEGEMRDVMLTRRESALSSPSADEWIAQGCFPLKFIGKEFSQYHENLPPDSTRIYRYEDVIFHKVEFLTDMLWFLGVTPDKSLVEKIAKKNDIIPDTIDPTKHVRRVRFGGYQDELSADTVLRIEQQYSSYIKAYHYDRPDQFESRLIFAYEGKESSEVLKHR